MRLRLRAVALLALSTLPACLIPERDNRNDPAHRPAPVLQVTDMTESDGTCPCSLGTAGAVVCPAPLTGTGVDVVSRGRCLALDARLSTDPDESDPELAFEFFVMTSAGESAALEQPAAGLIATNGVFLLSSGFRSSLPLGANRFRVRAVDRQGNVGRGDVQVSLTSSRPVLLAPSTRTYPLGGYPWLQDALGVAPPFDVEFRAAELVTDPDFSDREHLIFCWRFGDVPDEICRRGDDAPEFTRTIPSSVPSVLRASVRVSDWAGPVEEVLDHPETFSATAQTLVAVRDVGLWMQDRDGSFAVQRLDPIPGYLAQISGTPQVSSLPFVADFFGSDAVAYAYDDFASTKLVLADFPPQPLAGLSVALPTGASVVQVKADAASDRIWVLYEQSFPADEPLCLPPPGVNHSTLRAFDSSLAEQVCVHVPALSSDPQPLQVTVDSSGRVWMAPRFGGALFTVDAAPGSAVETHAAGSIDEPIHLGLSARPGTSEVWTVRRSVPFSSSVPGVVSVVRLDDPALEGIEYALDAPASVIGPWWIDQNLFWVFAQGPGFLLLDARLLEEGADMAGATVTAVPSEVAPEVTKLGAEMPDPVTGALWIRVALGAMALRVGADGSLMEFEAPQFRPLFVDPEGAVWHSSERGIMNDDVLLKGLVPGDVGVVTTVPTLSIDAQGDLAGGGIWVGGVLSPGIYRHAENGVLLESVTQFTNVQTNVAHALPPVARVGLSPDGSYAWILGFSFETFSERDLLVMDRRNGTGEILFAGETRAVEIRDAGTLFEPSAPIGGSTPFLWTAFDDGITTTVTQLAIDGTETPVLTIPADENDADLRGAMSLRTNALCLATFDAVAAEMVVRRLLPDGTVHLLGRVPSNSVAEAVSVSHDPEDVCWTAGDNASVWTVAAFRDDGNSTNAPDRTVPVNLIDFSGYVTGISARNLDNVWIAVDDPVTGFTRIALFDVPGGGAPILRTIFEGERKTSFVVAESSSE